MSLGKFTAVLGVSVSILGPANSDPRVGTHAWVAESAYAFNPSDGTAYRWSDALKSFVLSCHLCRCGGRPV